jgi:uncharacterized membrane protein YeiH
MVAVLAAVALGVLLDPFAERFERLVAYVDAIALAVYAVVGADKALVAGDAPLAAVLIGMANAVGGGLLRDILVREEPLLFKPGQFYVLAALGGCLLFVGLSYYGLPVEKGAAGGICTTLLLRLLAIRYNWKTLAVAEWRKPLRRPGGATDDHPDPTEEK